MSTTKFQISASQTGLSVYVILRNEENKVWDGTSLVTYNAANEADYDVALTETGSTAFYSADIPTTLPAGFYHVDFRAKFNPPSVSFTNDDRIFQRFFEWNGSEVVDDLGSSNSITDICNMALSHLYQGKEISNFETDTSQAGKACRRFFETLRDKTLRDFAWPFATKYAVLSLVEETPSEVNEEWAYSYRYPSDCLMMRRILSGSRNDSHASRVPYKFSRDSGGQIIYTDTEDARLEYTARIVAPTAWPADFRLAMSHHLAAYLAPRLATKASSGQKIMEDQMRLYRQTILEAAAMAYSEEQPDVEPPSSFEAARS